MNFNKIRINKNLNRLLKNILIISISSISLFFSEDEAFALSSTYNDGTWATNGSTNAIKVSGNTMYVGGTFTSVGRNVGYGVIYDTYGDELEKFPVIKGGDVTVAVKDQSGGWYIGGYFSSVDNVTRNRIAHIKSDGTLDIDWDPNADSLVNAIAVVGDTVYIGGQFTNIGGQNRNYLAALNNTTGAATAWDPNPSGGSYNYVLSLAVKDTTLYVGGRFLTIAGQARNRLASFETTDGSLNTWNPSLNERATALSISGNTVYVGGRFTTAGGLSHPYIAAINATSGEVLPWDPTANARVMSIYADSSTIYVGGNFTAIGGQSRNYIAAIDASTGNATSWNPSSNSTVNSVAKKGTLVYTGGSFTSIGGQNRNYAAALDTSTGNATSWNPSLGYSAWSLAVQGSHVFIGSGSNIINSVSRTNLAAFDLTTGKPTSWNPTTNQAVRAIEVSGQNIYIGGLFTSAGGQARNYLAALDASTGNATSWNPAPDYYVDTLLVNGTKLYVGGEYIFIDSVQKSGLAAFNVNTGSLTGTLAGYANDKVYNMVIDNGLLYVAGSLHRTGKAYVGVKSYNLATDAVTAWSPDIDGLNLVANTVAVDGSIVYIGGSFNTVNSDTRNYLAAIDASTGNTTAWNPNADYDVYAMIKTSSSIYIVGGFSTLFGSTREGAAEIELGTGNLLSWNPGLGAMSIATDGTNIYTNGFGLSKYDFSVVSSVAATPSSTGASISWNTDLDTSSIAEYGLTSDYGTVTSETDTSPRVQSHSVQVNNLNACTKYHYRVVSKNASGAYIWSPDNSFVTTGCAGSSSIISQNDLQITTTSGGIVSLLDANDTGVTLDVPQAFSGSDANFQINQLDRSTTLNAISNPTGKSAVGNYIYELKAMTDNSTPVTNFDNSITVSMVYGDDDVSGMDESTLEIHRWDGNSWNTLSGCIVDTVANTVTCTTSAFSVFGLFSPSITPTPTPTQSQQQNSQSPSPSSSSSNNSGSQTLCTDPKPESAPDLFQINTTKNTTTLFFVPVRKPYSGYYIAYGTKKDEEKYAVKFDIGEARGAIKYTINYLETGKKYYFRVKAINGCSSGEWGNSIAAYASKGTNYKNIFIPIVQKISSFIQKPVYNTKSAVEATTQTITKIEQPNRDKANTSTLSKKTQSSKTPPKKCFLFICF